MSERIIKKFEPRVDDIARIEALLERDDLTAYQEKSLSLELHKIRLGDSAEQKVSYWIGQFVKEFPVTTYLLNGLRLEDGDDIAQIDHLTLNRHGTVKLFETKSFTTGVKIEEDGSFWRWDGYNKKYVEIPSPIKQSKRHEYLLKKVLEGLGYTVNKINHFIVIDYKAKLIKPKKGFDMVCRPDMIGEADDKNIQEISVEKKFILRAQAFLKNVSEEKLKVISEQLASLHKPIEINFAKKFGIEIKPEEEVKEPQIEEPETKEELDVSNGEAQRLTLAKTAKKLGFKTKELEDKLIELGYLEAVGKHNNITEKAKSAGVTFSKGKFGYFVLFPEGFEL